MNEESRSFGTDEKRQNSRFVPLTAGVRVTKENGRWIVYLNVPSWEPDDGDHPVQNNWIRINDYSTEQAAEVAASWYEKSANRNIGPPLGF